MKDKVHGKEKEKNICTKELKIAVGAKRGKQMNARLARHRKKKERKKKKLKKSELASQREFT